MKILKNPFIVSGYVSADYFCDREVETEELTQALVNGRNTVIVSPRRMGKTGLIEHCFHQERIAREYYTFFVDIYEFQQIARYPEKNVEAVLRTHIQKCTNTTFVFAGSQRHMMQNIFFSASRPFYQSASFMNLGPIAEEAYRRFVQRHFRQAGKEISGECIERIYTLFEGHTWYMQSMLNRLYEQTAKGEGATLEEADIVLHQTVNAQQAMYQNMVAMLSERQKELLFAIGKEGRAREITSVDFVTRHGLYSSSSVQSAARQLLEKEFITKEENVYQVYDRFFGLWLAETYGTGYRL